MPYNPVTDFMVLGSKAPAGVTLEQMPGLDYVVAALARAGIVALHVGQSAPTSNQASIVWVKPSQPSWSAECKVHLWDAQLSAYVLATPALWAALFNLLGLGDTLATWRNQTLYGAAAPVSGTYARGDKVWNTQPAPGGVVGWVCVTAGSPGVWRSFGTIAA